MVGNHPDGKTLGASHALIDAFIGRDNTTKMQLRIFFLILKVQISAILLSSIAVLAQQKRSILSTFLTFLLQMEIKHFIKKN